MRVRISSSHEVMSSQILKISDSKFFLKHTRNDAWIVSATDLRHPASEFIYILSQSEMSNVSHSVLGLTSSASF